MAISVKAARVNAQLTQEEAAQRLGISPATYAKNERDPGRFTIDQAKRFCEIVGIDIQDVFFTA